MFAPRLRFLLWKPPHKLNHNYYKEYGQSFSNDFTLVYNRRKHAKVEKKIEKMSGIVWV
jgi:hypothetical protein